MLCVGLKFDQVLVLLTVASGSLGISTTTTIIIHLTRESVYY